MSDGPRLSIIPGWVALHPKMVGKDLQVLCVLGANANTQHGWTRRSQVKIAQQIGCARSTVQASINRLVEIGAVERREVVSESGRDSAHWYRVIYDSAPPAGFDFDAFDRAESEEFDPNVDGDNTTPPAGIPAPPAGLEPAPPAGPGPAPMLTPVGLTPADQRGEREREREPIDRKKIEREFRKWFPMWPTYLSDGEETARSAWFALTADERADCLARTADFVAAVKASGRTKFFAASTYLLSKSWKRMDDPTDDVAPPSKVDPYTRPWHGVRLFELLQPETPAKPAPTGYQRQQLALGGDAARKVVMERRVMWGWPRVKAMDEAKAAVASPAIIRLSEGFQPVKPDSELADAWRRLHERRGWPWLTIPDGLRMLHFPAIAPDADDLDHAVADALASYERALNEGRTDDAA